MNTIDRVNEAIKRLQQGQMIILTDHPDREDEGDLVFPAEKANANLISFMIKHCSGIICLSLLEKKIKQLGLHFMVPPHENESQRETPFMISIEAKHNITTGVSASDRAQTILTAIKDEASSSDIVKPGHIFPLKAQEEGVLKRAGHTEGANDIVRLAGFQPAAVLCELMNEDGTMMKGQSLIDFANDHQLFILSIEDIIKYRLQTENLIAEEVSTSLPIIGDVQFKVTAIRESISNKEHLVLEKYPLSVSPVLVRIHSSCATGDIFASLRCDCHQQLQYALKKIAEEGGILIYLNQEGRDIGLFNKIKTYALQENGWDTVEANQALGMPADSRAYFIAANVLRNKNIKNLRLLTNNPTKIDDLKRHGINNVIQESIPIFCNVYNKKYLMTKKNKLNHLIDQEKLDQFKAKENS